MATTILQKKKQIIDDDLAKGKESHLLQMRDRKYLKKTLGTDKADKRQIFNTLFIFLTFYAISHFLVNSYGFWFIPVSMFTGLVMARLFSLQHDLGHGSMIKNKKIRYMYGYLFSFFTHIPFVWHYEHTDHHIHTGELKNSDVSDSLTHDIKTYEKKSRWGKFSYIVFFRTGLHILGIGGLIYLFVYQRLVTSKKERLIDLGHSEEQASNIMKKKIINTWLTNIVLLVYYLSLYYLFGLDAVFNQVIMIWIFGIVAMFYFYSQHQHTYNYKISDEDYKKLGQDEKIKHQAYAAFLGSSHLKTGPFLNWCTADINKHRIHHWVLGISNRNLKIIYEKHEEFLKSLGTEITIWQAIKNMFFNHLYDSLLGQMISFGEYYRRRRCSKGIHRKLRDISNKASFNMKDLHKKSCETCGAITSYIEGEMKVTKKGIYDA